MAGMADLAFSMAMRDTIDRMVQERIDALRPKYRYATVKAIDRLNSKCDIVYNGEANQVRVNMGSIQPSAINQVVRIEGIGTDKFITDVLGPAWNGHRYGTTEAYYMSGGVKVTWEGDVAPSGPYYQTVNNYMPKPGETIMGIEVPGHGTVLAAVDDLGSRSADWGKAEPVNWYVFSLQNGFASYSNWWTPASGRYNIPRATRTRAGIIHLAGLIKCPVSPPVNTLICTLPVGMRPIQQGIFACNVSDPGVNYGGSVDIYPNGEVRTRVVHSNGYVSFDNIKFPAADAAVWSSPAFVSPWIQYPSPWDTVQYWQDSNGVVWEKGLINYPAGGNPANGIEMTTGMPANGPNRTMHRYTTAGNSTGGVYKLGNGKDAWQQVTGTGGASYVSLNSIPYPAPGAPIPWYPADTTSNGWTAYNAATYTAPGAWKTSDGMVMLSGLWATGSALGNGVIWELPQGLRPRDRCLVSTISNPGANARLDFMSTTGEIIAGFGVSGTWLSMDSLTFMAEN